MRIQEIEIDNFKSFKNQTKIPILAGFTAIAGPNGSGKSNIIDSILFCLGLSSSRTLRAEKLTDLINNTTSRREARVSIRLGEDQKDSPEAETLEVGRRIRENESGYQSTYYLNGKPSTLSEIHDRLALHNVTPNGYNVVMQGDVTRIISMTGFERRKILDELAGVAEFDARVNSAHAELEKVNESHERFGLILDEIANRLIQLQAERDQAIRYKKLSDEKVQCEAASKLAACWELKQKVLGLADMIASAQERSAGIEEKLDTAKALLGEKKTAHEALNEEIKQKGGAELLEVQDALEEARAGMEREKAAATYLLSQRNELARQEAKGEEERARAEQKKEELSVQLAELEERQARFLQDLEAARAEYERLQEAIMAIYAENEATSKKASELRIRLNEAKDRANEVYRKRMQAEEAAHRIGDKLAEQKEQLKHHRDAMHSLEGEAARFEEDGKKNQGQLNALEEELKALFGQKQWAQNVLAETEGEAEEARIHFHRIEAQLKAADESSFGRAVETVLKSGMQGIHGTLAQLGSADERYSHALEVAGGGKLRFIVCDDDGVASRGISLLKERRAGRATFLPLNKLSPERPRQPIDRPGFLGYAIDLLAFDDQYRDAFAFAFGETLVVDTIEHARPHIGKYRMVTLEGDLLERSGAMTGGSDGKAALRFTASLQREYEEAKVNLGSALKQLAKRKEELSAIESQIEGTRFKKDKQSEALRFLQLEAADRKRRIGETSVEIGRLETALASSKEEEKQYKTQIESFSKQMLKDDELLNELELELSDLEDSLAESQLGELNSQASSAEYQVSTLQSQHKNGEIDRQALVFQLERCDEAIREAEAESTRRKEAWQKLDREEAENKAKQAEFDNRFAEAMVRREALREQLGELNTQRDRSLDELRGIERTISDIEREADRLTEAMNTTETQLSEKKEELAQLEDALWLQGIEPPNEPVEEGTQALARKIESLTERMKHMGLVNMLAIDEYEAVAARQADLQEKLDRLQEERNQLLERIAHFAQLKKQCFMEVFDKVNEHFQTIFHELSDGMGELVLENPEDPFSGGLVIKAQPREKKMQRLEAMSGGEKSLTALAFVFSLQRTNPAPFYAMDEVDAALDGVNAEHLAEMIKKQTEAAQLIVVSHRKPMLVRADQTIGVSARADGVSKVTGVKWM